jgi:hypothetical protein
MATSELAEAHIDKSVEKVAYHKGRAIDNTGAVVIHKPDGYYIKEFGKKSEYLGKHIVPADYDFTNNPTQSPALPAPPPTSQPSSSSESWYSTAFTVGAAASAANFDLYGTALDLASYAGDAVQTLGLQAMGYTPDYVAGAMQAATEWGISFDFLKAQFGPRIAREIMNQYRPNDVIPTLDNLITQAQEIARWYVRERGGIATRAGRQIRRPAWHDDYV